MKKACHRHLTDHLFGLPGIFPEFTKGEICGHVKRIASTSASEYDK